MYVCLIIVDRHLFFLLYLVLFIMLYKVVLLFRVFVKSQSVTTQTKASEKKFTKVLFIMLSKLVLTLQSLDEILK